MTMDEARLAPRKRSISLMVVSCLVLMGAWMTGDSDAMPMMPEQNMQPRVAGINHHHAPGIAIFLVGVNPCVY